MKRDGIYLSEGGESLQCCEDCCDIEVEHGWLTKVSAKALVEAAIAHGNIFVPRS